jgi:hypothetical protein
MWADVGLSRFIYLLLKLLSSASRDSMKCIRHLRTISTSDITTRKQQIIPTIKSGQRGLDIWHLPHESELARLVGQAIHLVSNLAKESGYRMAIIAGGIGRLGLAVNGEAYGGTLDTKDVGGLLLREAALFGEALGSLYGFCG